MLGVPSGIGNAIKRDKWVHTYSQSSSKSQRVLSHDQLPPATSEMADTKPPIYQQAVRLALDVANGQHFLSKLVLPALLLADTLLCALVIWRVPCKPHSQSSRSCTSGPY